MLKDVYDGWNDAEDMLAEFSEDMAVLDGYNVIVAAYDTGDYSGDAFVLLEKDGNYYEVNGGHCSCYGLEGQWTLEETAELALKHRCFEGSSYGGFAMAKDVMKEHFGW